MFITQPWLWVMLVLYLFNSAMLVGVTVFFERNVRLNWLVHERLNLLALAVILIIVCLLAQQLLSAVPLVLLLALHDPLDFHVYQLLPWFIINALLSVVLFVSGASVFFRRMLVITYEGEELTFKVVNVRTPKKSKPPQGGAV